MAHYVRSLLLGGQGYLQMFSADGGQGGSGSNDGGNGDGGQGDGGSNGADDQNSLDELMKDPIFKAQYEAKMKEQIGKRLKKYDGIDPEEYKRLKDLEDKKKEDEMTEAQKLQAKIDKLEAERVTLAEKEKDIAIKQYALDNSLDPKLIARLINKSDIKSSEDAEGIESAVAAVKEEFPQLFQSEEGSEGGNEGGTKKGTKFPNQKGNPEHKKNTYDAGKARALARHGKKE